ncbi:MAG: hypothetical protein ABIO86_02375 [Sphingomonas sp.]
MRTGDEETRSPKYAHIERERRFLVDRARRPDLAGLAWVEIDDRYITGTRLRLRRMTDGATGQVGLKLTKKYEADDPRARPIVTAYLDEAEYALFASLPAHRLVKRRYEVETPGGMFGIDIFEGNLAGLELAEIECPDDATLNALVVPNWAMADVSDDIRFQGGRLSLCWPAGVAALLAEMAAR